MQRVYTSILQDHFHHVDKAAFLSGPRQVGKTTISSDYIATYEDHFYFNWDIVEDRERLLAGQSTLFSSLMTTHLSASPLAVIFDEMHKYKDWKNYVKGFIDLSRDSVHTLVTGSSKLNVYRRGGDSMMGRYFLYRVHPLTLRELLSPTYSLDVIQEPKKPDPDMLVSLFNFSGFPEPLSDGSQRFVRRWQALRHHQLFAEDIRELTRIQEIKLMENLAAILEAHAGQHINYANLATKIRVSEPTVRHWIETLEQFYYCYTIQPWQANVTRSLIKTPKLYLWDWALVSDMGARWENLVAGHLYKAVQCWSDLGLGDYELYYLRDKEQREVDFLVVKDAKPWMLVEVKYSGKTALSKTLLHYQQLTHAPYAFQVAIDLPYKDVDCFSAAGAKIVPAQTFLSQLV